MVAPHRAVATAAANDAGLAPLQTAALLGSIPNVPSIAAALPPGSRVAQENITRGQYPEAARRAASVAAVVADAAAKTLPDASTDKGTPTDGTPENDGTRKNDGTLVPGHAAWFRASPKPPRAVERRGVPEFSRGGARDARGVRRRARRDDSRRSRVRRAGGGDDSRGRARVRVRGVIGVRVDARDGGARVYDFCVGGA